MKSNSPEWRTAAVTTLAAAALIACGGGRDDPPAEQGPESIAMTWFGITNRHCQIGNVGILLDGETISAGSTPNVASVTKALASVLRGGMLDVILVGHEHVDHSVQAPEWAKQTGKPVCAPGRVCARFAAAGLPASQCTTLDGGEKITLNAFVDVHVVRRVHSVDCTELSNGTGGAETFGFLIVARTGKGDEKLNLYVSDSPDLPQPDVELELGVPVRIGTGVREPERAPGSGAEAGRRLIIQVAEATSTRRAFTQKFVVRSALRDAAMLSMVGLTLAILVTLALRPVTRLADEASRRPVSDLEPLGDAGLPSDIKSLVGAVNRQMERISELMGRQRPSSMTPRTSCAPRSRRCMRRWGTRCGSARRRKRSTR